MTVPEHDRSQNDDQPGLDIRKAELPLDRWQSREDEGLAHGGDQNGTVNLSWLGCP